MYSTHVCICADMAGRSYQLQPLTSFMRIACVDTIVTSQAMRQQLLQRLATLTARLAVLSLLNQATIHIYYLQNTSRSAVT